MPRQPTLPQAPPVGILASCHDDRDVLLMKSRSALSNQIVELQPQREQGRTHLFQLHNAEKGQAKPRTTNGKLAIRGTLSMGRHGSTIHRQRGSWIQGLPGRGSPSCLMLFELHLFAAINTKYECIIYFRCWYAVLEDWH